MVIMRMRTLVIARNAIIIIITTIVATSTYATLFGHILKDNISLITRIELAVEEFLHYARDYASIAVSFIIKQIEEAVVSKHKDSSTYMIARADIQVVKDKHYSNSNKNELITIRSKATIISIEEKDNREGEGEKRESEGGGRGEEGI